MHTNVRTVIPVCAGEQYSHSHKRQNCYSGLCRRTTQSITQTSLLYRSVNENNTCTQTLELLFRSVQENNTVMHTNVRTVIPVCVWEQHMHTNVRTVISVCTGELHMHTNIRTVISVCDWEQHMHTNVRTVIPVCEGEQHGHAHKRQNCYSGLCRRTIQSFTQTSELLFRSVQENNTVNHTNVTVIPVCE